MTLDELLDHFDGARWNGTQWLARCPAHDDRSPSLAISEGDDGTPLLYCHAGCTATDVLKAIGLSWRDVTPRQEEVKPTEVATYDYRDADGGLLYQVVRMEPKGFRQRRPADNYTGWEYNLQGVERVPYRLPELLAGILVNKQIHICEGEKDVDAIYAAGGYATCNSGGAGKWDPDFARYFKGANVTIVVDKDEPGRKHAREVRDSLQGVVSNLWTVEAKEGKDAFDHIAAGYKSFDFIPVDLDAPVWRFAALDLDIDVPPAEWLLDELVCMGDATLLYGQPKAGKTWFSMGLAIAVSHGKPFFVGRNVHKHGRVLYLDEEMPLDLIYTRLRKLGLDRDRWRGSFRYVWRQGLRLDETPELLLAEAQQFEPTLIVIDNLTRTHRGEENSLEGIGAVMADGILPLARETGAAVLLLHHSNAAGERPRGHSDITGVVDNIIKLERDDDHASRFVISNGQARRVAGGSRIPVDIVDKSDGTVELVPDLLPQMRSAA